MRLLLSSTCLLAISTVVAAPAAAETVISTATTTPIATGTANDDIRITTAGSIKPTSGVAVTINSNDSVRNDGTIAIQGANNSAGIVALPGFSGNITNTGTITIDENFTPTDSDNDGDIDGPFAQGSNRFGIRVLPGGTYTGTILHSGTITVEGNASAGIAVDSALVGSIIVRDDILVAGNDSFGIRAGDVSGNVTLSDGAISVRGEDSIGVALTGDIGGALVIQNSVSSTGYRYTSIPTDPSKLDADDLLQGGSAVVISGNVAGGILFDARPKDNSTTDNDEDDDGVIDTSESTAAIVTLGSAPAVRIGSSSEAINIGAVAGSGGYGLVVKGTISGNGLYEGVSGTGLSIGGTGHAVTIAGGIDISGGITGRANEANATGIRIGADATVPKINVSGSVQAVGGGTSTTAARAILIDSGATLNTITNSGTISAGRPGDAGTATAILDNSGTLTLVENRGIIGVGNVAELGDNAVALDLRANTSGVTVRQLAVAATADEPLIQGNVLLGSGNDVVEITDGALIGKTMFGAGNNSLALSGDAQVSGNVSFGAGSDSLSLAGTSVLTGTVDFGGGADSLSLTGASTLSGFLTGSSGLAVNVGAGSTLDMTSAGAIELASLTTGEGSTLGIALDGSTGSVTTYNVAGAANFGADTTIDVNLLSVGGVAGTYTIVDAGSLTGVENLSSTAADLPFLYSSSVAAGDAGEVELTVSVKSATELGLNDSESGILAAAMNAADADSAIASVFLGAANSEDVRSTLQQLLPEHAGGAFENVTKGSRLATGILADPRPPLVESGGLGLWVQQVAWGTSKSIGSTSSYDLSGWGAAGGIERNFGAIGSLGVSLAYLSGKDSESGTELIANTYEAGVYWRKSAGPLLAFAKAAAGMANFDGRRTFTGVEDGTDFVREADGDWDGKLYSATAGVSYEARMGRVGIRPLASIEYYNLKEDGYVETGGGEAFDLTVRDRSSNETAANATVTLAYDLLSLDREQPWLRVELEGGRRQILSGSLGATTASFGDGAAFTLTPEERTSGWRAALRLLGGGPTVAIGAEIGGEEQQGKASIGGRIGVRFAL